MLLAGFWGGVSGAGANVGGGGVGHSVLMGGVF